MRNIPNTLLVPCLYSVSSSPSCSETALEQKKEREKQREEMNSLGFLARKQHFFVCFSSKNETLPEIPKFSDLKVYLELETGNWIFGLFPVLTLNKNHQDLMFLAGIILSLSLLWVREGVGSISFSFSSKIKEKTIEMLIYSPCSSGARTEFWLLLAVVFI